MGAVESREPVTPARPLRNRHLAHVTDPRSPTAGIPRTPIELGDPAQKTPQSCNEEETLDLTEFCDPRSPTHGIARTPLRPPIHVALNLLATQLSEVFVADDLEPEGNLMVCTDVVATPTEEHPVEHPPAPGAHFGVESAAVLTEEPSKETTLPLIEDPLVPSEGEEKDGPLEARDTAVVHSTVSTGPALPVGPKTRCKSPHSVGMKNVRQRPRKALVPSVSGRSPLKILQEDNSPKPTVQYKQGKKLYFQGEPPASHRALKISHSGWETSHNKENAQYGQSES